MANYLAEIEAGVIWRDALQAQVVDEFERLHQNLLQQSQTKRWFFQSALAAPQGIYIHGSVGRGKTHLMDLFYDSLPADIGKQRQHYHEFMLWLHQALRSTPDTKDPLDLVCRRLAKQVKVLCLDEFLVNDIANAMLLAGMLAAFSRYGIAMVTTSNVRPDDLYRDGLQRVKFLPAIDWIKQHMQVLHLDGDQDYRLQDDPNHQHEHWYFPINASSRYHLQDCFQQKTQFQAPDLTAWLINDRTLPIVGHAENTLWCDFAALCEQPRHATDYLVIAERINTLVLENIPVMSANDDSAARRFITLIDVLYEHGVKLIAQAACHYQMIYQGDKLAFEFQRAASRLAEMLLD
nr:cell division protein ZapE [Marinicella sp. NBU2979]